MWWSIDLVLMQKRSGSGWQKRKFLIFGMVFLAAFMGFFKPHAMAQDSHTPVIQKIEIMGNRRIDSGTILNKIGSRAGEPLSLETIREDIRAIYGMGGYFENVQVESEPVDGVVRLIFRVEEKPIISGITLEGNKEVEEGKIRDVLNSRLGSPYSLQRIKNDKKAIQQLYQNEGFYFVQIQSSVEEDKNQNKKLTYKIDEGKKVIIGEIFLQGNKNLKNKHIKKKAMETKEHWMFSFLTSAGVYKREILDIDLERIKDYYFSHGYLEVKVGEPEISFDKPRRRSRDRFYEFLKGWGWNKNEIAITIPISEGAQYRIGKMAFQGNTAVPEETLRFSLASREGEVFSSEYIRADMMKITHQFGEKGYAFASVSPLTDLNREKQTVDLTWDVEEGNRVYIGEINITGNVRTRDNVIRREIRFHEGDQYNIAKIDRSKVRIRNTGFFEDVQDATNRRPGEQVVDLDVKVKERQTGSLSFGVGASSTQGLIGSFDVRQTNIFGTGRELNVAAIVGGEDSSFNFRFVEPWLFDREISLGFSLFKTIGDYDSFEEESTGGSITFGKALDEYSRGSISFNYEEIEFTNVDPTLQQGLTDTQSVFGVVLGWRRNTVDNILDPTRGYIARASAEFAGFLGDADFNKYYVSDRVFYKGPWKTTFSVNAEAGLVDVDSANDIPVSDLFFLGGIESLRGFQYRSLGPRNFFGSLIGGRKLLLTNTELYFPVVQSVGLNGFLFFDAGKVYDPVGETIIVEQIDLDNDGDIDAFQEVRKPNLTDGDEWKKSYGIGFLWRSPAGPIKIVWAKVLNPEFFDEEETIQFSLGTTF
jgi:outer membrane protein insertion porin family